MTDLEKVRELIQQLGKGKYKDGSSSKVGYAYHKLPFSELEDVPYQKDISSEFLIIQDDLKIIPRKTTILDIGSAGGYYCFKFVEQGAIVVGFEADPHAYKLLQAMRRWKEVKNLLFYHQPFDEIRASASPPVDTIIMMNVHMWIEKQIGISRTDHMMKILSKKCQNIYFQTAHAESGGRFVCKRLHNLRFIHWYLEDCGFKNVKTLSSSNIHKGIRYLCKAEGKLFSGVK